MEDHSVERKVNELVSDNKLEEALNLLLANAGEAQRRENALFVLKGRLASLEEQELGGMISFEELARQKAVLAHRILDIADGSSLDEELPKPAPPANNGSPMMKYLLIGGAILLVIGLIAFVMPGDAETTPEQADVPTTIEPTVPSNNNRGEPTTQVEKDEPKKQDDTEKKPQPTKREGIPVPPSESEKEEEKAPPPPPPSQVSIPDFPNVGRKFLYRDLYLTFKKPELELVNSRVKMKLNLDIKCRNNLGYCEREVVKVFVDGQPFLPTKKSSATTLNNGSVLQEELTFDLPANASNYQLSISKADGNGPWKRGFRVLVN